MPRDSDYSRLPHVEFGFLHSGNLFEIEDAGIQEEKAQKIRRPCYRVGQVVLP